MVVFRRERGRMLRVALIRENKGASVIKTDFKIKRNGGGKKKNQMRAIEKIFCLNASIYVL